MSPFRHAVFFRSVHDLEELPPDDGTEIAFAGRSNAGKSTAINALADHKRLAFTSKTPGRTQTINFFSLAPRCFLVDLPGYGYAAVPAKEKRHWALLVSTYIQTRASLSGLVLIMDARQPFTVLDRQLLDWLAPLHKRAHVLLTKADKLNRQESMAALYAAEVAARHYPGCSVQLFSGTTGLGVKTAQKTLAQWLKK